MKVKIEFFIDAPEDIAEIISEELKISVEVISGTYNVTPTGIKAKLGQKSPYMSR